MPLPLPAARALLAVLAFALAGTTPAQAVDLGACVGHEVAGTPPDAQVAPLPGLLTPTSSIQVHSVQEACNRINPSPILPPCSDGEDSDGDGAADFPDDPGCDGPLDPSEKPECSDHLDNDGDMHTDYPYEPGCESPDDPSETECGPANPLACGNAGVAGGLACPASPVPPLLLEAEWVGEAVVLEWEPALREPAAYLIYRVQGEGPVFEDVTEPLAGVSGAATTYTDTTASGWGTYVYWVTSAGAGCESPPSPPAGVGPIDPDLSDCVDPNIDDDPPSVEPEYKGTECVT